MWLIKIKTVIGMNLAAQNDCTLHMICLTTMLQQFIPGQCMRLCEWSELRGGGTREQWVGRPDRRPAVSTNVHHGTARQ